MASYPRFLQDNPYPLEIAYAELDELAARVNAAEAVEAPTGVGFCIYLRRDCLAEIGDFDEDPFGRGYGEENELCQRAIAAGWRNLIAADVFVHHLG
ncbi:MAG: glycosyltransferase family 2 protein, partial [bacterium]